MENVVNIVASERNILTIDKKIKDCNSDQLFNLICAKFVIFFLDLQEVNDFIRNLTENDGELTIQDLLENFKDILKKFRNKK